MHLKLLILHTHQQLDLSDNHDDEIQFLSCLNYVELRLKISVSGIVCKRSLLRVIRYMSKPVSYTHLDVYKRQLLGAEFLQVCVCVPTDGISRLM